MHRAPTDAGRRVIDRSKSLDRHDRQTSILPKLLTYHRAWRDKLHAGRLGWENFRVLTVSTSDKRIDSMLEAVKATTEGPGLSLFLFATAETLRSADILTIKWRTGKGEWLLLSD